jgi:hypothetical protein
MSFINLTPHAVQVYGQAQFVSLEQVNPTTWVADSVEGNPVVEFQSVGNLRIATEAVEQPSVDGVPMMATEYGKLVGRPDDLVISPEDRLIVSLPTKSMAVAAGYSLAGQMVSPYKVVRSRENGSLVLGCMGFTY